MCGRGLTVEEEGVHDDNFKTPPVEEVAVLGAAADRPPDDVPGTIPASSVAGAPRANVSLA